ncbi:CoA transferase [Actinomadura sp. WAC 06369]|uniref:CoA transferase n=1 Tax=Actinomadura sp. WAC 06369 TaxID=2203193 RepID=UPI000F7BA8AB|nr:CoA transferase [Actinomadura sp. WAC 06369]RSN71812.1 CoA transferase [Actinomadura sp. WAC 06369]
MAISAIGRRAWRDLDGDPSALDLIEAPEPAVVLPSALDVAALVTDGVALTALAVHLASAGRTGRPPAPVHLRGDRITTSVSSERHFRLNADEPDVWAPLSGFWRTADGWVRTHANYPHHEHRLRRLVGIGPDASPETFARALTRWNALDLEERAATAGAVVAAVRDEAAWRRHPRARADAPLIPATWTDGAAPRAWSGTGRPLAGVRVLDLTRVIAGPVATRDLAFAGADVLRIDSPRHPEIGWQHLDTGQGKRSATLDLDVPEDRALLDGLLRRADAVVTGYRPGSLDRRGLSPAELTGRFPGLVVGTVSAWGTAGPWAGRRGFDSIVQAATGIALLEGPGGGTPASLPAQVLDHTAGHLLAAAVVRCLGDQRRRGGSWHVSIALARVAAELLAAPRPDRAAAGGPAPATVQTYRTPAGALTCAAPVLTYAGAPARYPDAGRPWGADRPGWLGG